MSIEDQRKLIYWKARKVDLRESILELFKTYRFADEKVRQLEQMILHQRKQ